VNKPTKSSTLAETQVSGCLFMEEAAQHREEMLRCAARSTVKKCWTFME
jgi:hypothetical protein